LKGARQNGHITAERRPLGDGPAPDLSTVATMACAARQNDGDTEHPGPDAIGDCAELRRARGIAMEDHRWRPLAVFAPVSLSERELKALLHRGVVVAATEAGEFVEAIKIASAELHVDRWCKWHVHYLPGPPGCYEPLWLPSSTKTDHRATCTEGHRRRHSHSDQTPRTTAPDRG
jgi:hypothetical protein